MTRGRAPALAAWLTSAAAVLPGTAAAQSFVPQPQRYLLAVDAFDARALWLQPAGLARRREASVGGLVTLGASGGVSQYGVTIASGGLGLGWQHERTSSAGIDVFAVGLGVGDVRAAVGVDHVWYRGGNTKDRSWDFGGRFAPASALDLSLVWRDVGSPALFVDTISQTINSTLVPGAAVNLWGGRARLAVEWEIVTRSWGTSALRAGAHANLGAGFGVLVRSDFSSSPEARALAVSLTWNGAEARASGFAQILHGDSDHYGVWAASVRELSQRRRRRRYR